MFRELLETDRAAGRLDELRKAAYEYLAFSLDKLRDYNSRMTRAPWDGEFPRYVWYKRGDIAFEGRLVNRGNGSYKGYPLGRDEWPDGIEAIHAGA